MEKKRALRIVLTGGGTVGHVAVNLALIPRLLADGWEVSYIGSEKGLEKGLLEDYPAVPYYSIPTGKLRRGQGHLLSRENARDVAHVLQGYRAAKKKIRTLAPDVVFSKGGFVSVPVVYAAHACRVPAITHESDLTPGLANRLLTPMVREVLCTFPETMEVLPKKKAFYLGPVIREQIRGGDAARGRRTFGFADEKPVLVILGGSLGAAHLNEAVRASLAALLPTFNILHGCGAGKLDTSIRRPGYVQREYIREEMRDVLAMADIVVSRAGANAIFELLYYRKPMLLVPLPTAGSRGDQLKNAQNFAAKGYAQVLPDEALEEGGLVRALHALVLDQEAMKSAQERFSFSDTVETILAHLRALAEEHATRR